MRHYKHRTQEQRYQISSLLQTGISQSEISRIVGVSKSTISRELNRNTGKRGYRPKQAHHFAIDRKANNSQSITDFGWAYVEALLAKKFSPEQITGRLRYLGWQGVPSHERIYQYIYAVKKPTESEAQRTTTDAVNLLNGLILHNVHSSLIIDSVLVIMKATPLSVKGTRACW